MTSEKQILACVKDESQKLGLYSLRISMRPGVEVGWPDTFVFGPGRVLGLETKRPGKKATPIQIERGKTMTAYGQAWAKCDTKADVKFTLMNFARHCVNERLLSRTEWDAQTGNF